MEHKRASKLSNRRTEAEEEEEVGRGKGDQLVQYVV